MKALRKKIAVAMVMALCALGTMAQGFAIDPRPVQAVSGTAAGNPTKQEMMSRLRRWVALTFERSDVIDMKDEAAGTMVLKWSAVVPQPSQWLVAALSETCVIDVADGGAWTLQIYSPRLSWGLTDTAAMLEDAGLAGAEAQADMGLIRGLAKRVYSDSMEWPVDEQLDTVVAAYLENLNAKQQFRSDRDRERGKASDEYRAAERQWRILSEARRATELYNATLVQSLSRAMAATGK